MKELTNKTAWGRTDTFEVVNEFPHGYQIWNIGRSNFLYARYIPLCKVEGFNVVKSSLKAIECPSEAIALQLLKEAGRETVGRKRYYQVVHEEERI